MAHQLEYQLHRYYNKRIWQGMLEMKKYNNIEIIDICFQIKYFMQSVNYSNYDILQLV